MHKRPLQRFQNPIHSFRSRSIFEGHIPINWSHGAVAQLARAPALHAGGQEFESPQLHHEPFENIKFSQVHGSAKIFSSNGS